MTIHRLDTEIISKQLTNIALRTNHSERAVAIGFALIAMMFIGMLVVVRSLMGRVEPKLLTSNREGNNDSPIPLPHFEKAKQAMESLKRINRLFDVVLKDTKKHLNGETSKQLLSDIATFHQQFPVNRKDLALASIHSEVESVEKHLKWLQEKGTILYSYRIPHIPGDIVPVPDQGNCLFDAVFHQLKFMNLTQSKGINKPEDLRIEVVKWMRENSNDIQLIEYINLAMEAYKVARNIDLSDQEEVFRLMEEEKQDCSEKLAVWKKEKKELEELKTPTQYFSLVSQDRFFGSIAEIYALSRMLNVNITIHKVINGRALEGYDEIFCSDPPSKTTLHLTHENGRHFNSVVV